MADNRTPYVEALYYGPEIVGGQPRQIVIHSLECDIKPGIAVELAKGWFRNPGNKSSAHTLTDPTTQATCVPEGQRAWHCGNGNNTSKGKEHAGRASFTKAQWLTDAGVAMLRASAKDVALDCVQYGIPVRWLSVPQVADNELGLCTHNDMRLARGGTTHWDPGPGFPYAEFLAMVAKEVAAIKKTPNTPAPTPDPPPPTQWSTSCPCPERPPPTSRSSRTSSTER